MAAPERATSPIEGRAIGRDRGRSVRARRPSASDKTDPSVPRSPSGVARLLAAVWDRRAAPPRMGEGKQA